MRTRWEMPILTMATVFKEMYLPNQIVEYKGQPGRVLYVDPIQQYIHVLIRTNQNTWKIEKCDSLFCKPIHAFLWTIESAFCIRRQRTTQTPHLAPLEIQEIDHVMEL
jgi:hypothetical protein